MKTLILMRHGLAGGGASDFSRPLTPHGRDQVRVQAPRIEKFTPIDLALVSGATRTQETWETLARAGIKAGAVRVERDLYSAGWRDVVALVKATAGEADTVLVVGHEPTMSAATALLAAPDSPGVTAGYASFSTATFSVGRLVTAEDWTDLDARMLRVDAVVRPGI